jgi:hypothetical protein
MFGDLFGDYLIKTGVITADQLDSAIAAQRENNRLLGYLAVERNLISEAELSNILAVQAEQPKKFGDIAVELKLLTPDQVQELLEIQSGNHLYLGEALVREDILDLTQLSHYLNEYREASGRASAEMEAELDATKDKELIRLALEALRSFFFRAGYVVKVGKISHSYPNTQPVLFAGTYQFRRHRTVYIGPALPESIVDHLLYEAPGSRSRDISTRSSIEYFEQVFYNLSYYVCQEARKKSIRSRHGAIHTALPEGLPVVSFRMIGLPETFWVIYAVS